MKYLNRRRFVLSTIAVAVGKVHAGTLSGGATEWTQIANNVQLVMQYAKQMEQYATQLRQWTLQIKQYENMIMNTLTLPKQIWGEIQQELKGVSDLLAAGKALAFAASNFGADFQRKYKGYQYRPGQKWEDVYKQWSETSRDTIKNTLEAVGLQSNQFATEEGVMKQLRLASETADGQMKALQVGAQIAEQGVQQLQKLRQLMIAQIQSQNSYMAAQQDKEDMIQYQRAEAFKYQDPRGASTDFRGGSR